jgi:hypothetical protein
MKKVPLLGFFLLLPLMVFGRIGDTKDEAIARYGSPIKSDKEILTFEKTGFYIVCQFYEEKVFSISFLKTDLKVFTKDEALALRDRISPNLDWDEPPGSFGTKWLGHRIDATSISDPRLKEVTIVFLENEPPKPCLCFYRDDIAKKKMKAEEKKNTDRIEGL